MSKTRIKKARRFIKWLHENACSVSKYRAMVACQQIFGKKEFYAVIGGYRVRLKKVKTYGII